METRFDDTQLAWIKEILEQHGKYLHDLMLQQLKQKKIKVSGNLEDSIHQKVTMLGQEPKLSFDFLDYGRFIEIRYHRSKNSRMLMSGRPNGILAALHASANTGKSKKAKDTRCYARTVYGSLNRLIGILMYEFSEEERLRIKSMLTQNQNP